MHPRVLLTVGLALALAAAPACGTGEREAGETAAAPGTGAPASAWSLRLEPLPLVGAGNSVAPQLTSSGDRMILSWLERAGDNATLRFVDRTPDGWTEPRTVATGPDWFVSWADAPTVLRLSDGTIAAAWFVNTRAEIEAYDIYLSYSNDEGKTWATPFRPHRDGTQTQHGFATLVEMPERELGLVWLDGRDMENNTTDPEGGVMTLRFTSFDRAWQQRADVEVDRRVCECCQTAAALTSEGVITAFRDRSETEIRDIMVARLEDRRWSPAVPVRADNWETDSCPVNGPALSARGRDVVATWFTVQEGQGHAFAAFSHDAGRTWSRPTRLDESRSLGYVDVEMLDDGSAVASWVEFAPAGRTFMLRRIEPSGARSAAITVAGANGSTLSGYPRMARTRDELVFAWTQSTGGEDGAPQIRGAVARLP